MCQMAGVVKGRQPIQRLWQAPPLCMSRSKTLPQDSAYFLHPFGKVPDFGTELSCVLAHEDLAKANDRIP